jgi:hypothetical protein
MTWEQICAHYGIDWAVFVTDLEIRAGDLAPEADAYWAFPVPGTPLTYANPDAAVAAALGCTTQVVDQVRQYHLDPFISYVIMRLTVLCGCSPSDITQWLIIMSWSKCCAHYGINWNDLVADVQARMAGLDPEAYANWVYPWTGTVVTYNNPDTVVAAALGCAVQDVDAVRQLYLDPYTSYLILWILGRCGCHLQDILTLRLTMGWDEICATYGLDWATCQADLDNRTAALLPEVTTVNQIVRGDANDLTYFPIEVPPTAAVPGQPLNLPSSVQGACP